MMGGGEFKSSLVQQMVVWGGTINRNIKSGLMPCAEEQEESTKMPPLASPSLLFSHDHHQLLHLSSDQVPEVGSTATSPANLHGGQEDHMPESWRQMLLGGLIGDHERYSSTATALLSKGLEGPVPQAGAAYNFCEHGGGDEISKSQSQLSQMLLASSPRSCISTSLGGGMLDFSNSGAAPAPEVRNHHSDNSCESNSTTTGSALKKARVQASSSAQSTLKMRKERLGDRITVLHQIVSPFGKTDTASVLQETVGYIRFLLGQIEALSYPYMENGSSMRQGTLLNHSNHNNATTELAPQAEKDSEDGEEGKEEDLRSRGLCLMPVSCTSHLGADNASDFWAPLPPPPPPAGIILR